MRKNRVDLIFVLIILLLVILYSFYYQRSWYYEIAPILDFVCLLYLLYAGVNIFRSSLLKLICLFLFHWTISSFNYLYFINQTIPYYKYFSHTISVFMVFLSIFSFSIRCKYYKTVLYYWGCIYYLCGVYFNYYTYITYSDIVTVSNIFYYVLMPLPLVFISNNKMLNWSFLIVALVVAVFALKRSAIISIVLVSLLYFYVSMRKSYTVFIQIVFVLVVFSLFVSFLGIDLISSKYELLNHRFETFYDDRGSGRIDLLVEFINKDVKDLFSFPELFIGNGFASYKDKVLGLHEAYHNDFVDVLYSFGIIGVLFLLFFYFLLLKRLVYIKNNIEPLYIPYLISIVLFMIYSFSGGMFYFLYYSIPVFVCIAMSEASIVKSKMGTVKF